jgi:hypothetical protein
MLRDFQEINYPKKRTTEAQSTQRENFCISFGTFFYLEGEGTGFLLFPPFTRGKGGNNVMKITGYDFSNIL